MARLDHQETASIGRRRRLIVALALALVPLAAQPQNQLPRHLYAFRDGMVYGYASSTAESVDPAARVRYLGRRARAFVAEFDTGASDTVEMSCEHPCEFVKVAPVSRSGPAKSVTLPVAQGTVTWKAFTDIQMGSLAIDRAARKPGWPAPLALKPGQIVRVLPHSVMCLARDALELIELAQRNDDARSIEMLGPSCVIQADPKAYQVVRVVRSRVRGPVAELSIIMADGVRLSFWTDVENAEPFVLPPG